MKTLTKISLTTALSVSLIVGLAGHTFADVPPAAAAAGSTLQQRVDQRKTERSVSLADKDKQRIVTTCVAAQAKIRLVQSDAAKTLDQHTKVYGTVDSRLWIAIGQLKFAGQDTFQLQKERQTLSDKSDAFQVLATNYKQSLDDTVVMNCAADPVGFVALIGTIRVYYAELKTQSADSRDYMVNTIKPTLTSHTSDLQAKTDGTSGN